MVFKLGLGSVLQVGVIRENNSINHLYLGERARVRGFSF
jgi:hypothetical protein